MRSIPLNCTLIVCLLTTAAMLGESAQPLAASSNFSGQPAAQTSPFEAEEKAIAKDRKRLTEWKNDLERRKTDLKARAHRFNENPKDKNELAAIKAALATLTADIHRYNEEHDEFVTRTRRFRELVQQRITQVEETRKRTRAAIERVRERLGEPAKAIDEWVELTEEARHDAQWKAVNTLVSYLLARKQLNELKEVKDREEFVKKLEQNLLRDKIKFDQRPDLRKAAEGALRFFNQRLEEARQSADKAVHFIEKIERLQAVVNTDRQLLLSHTDYWEIVVEFLKLGLHDPKYKLLVADVEVWVPVVYWYGLPGVKKGVKATAAAAVDDLLKWSDSQLVEVRNYSRAMVRETDELRRLRALEKDLSRPD